jgi:metal-sulfur cluster biosynthetic enzyme
MNIDIKDPQYAGKNRVIAALYEVADPELGINIIDLGLVYDITIDEAKKEVFIEMTLSTRSCPLGGIITGHVKAATEEAMPGYVATVTLVWEPKWNADRITKQGKSELGW